MRNCFLIGCLILSVTVVLSFFMGFYYVVTSNPYTRDLPSLCIFALTVILGIIGLWGFDVLLRKVWPFSSCNERFKKIVDRELFVERYKTIQRQYFDKQIEADNKRREYFNTEERRKELIPSENGDE